MVVSANITDRTLQEQISNYIENRQKEVNDLMIEALKYFFNKKNGSTLNYKIQDAEQNAEVLDFGIKDSNLNYKLFEDIDDVATYAKELRDNAWK
ncbi:MAG: hypothetical protein GXO60_01965 [Epsilonproteobacteria bacterium]|nr:hypothetical protein [Campylobacterota bacterium]